MTDEDIKQKCIKYLIECGFVDNYVKKLMWSSDIDNLYDDFKQEVYLSLLEVPAEKYYTLYTNSVEGNDKDEFYQVRNWSSRLIGNIVHSSSSAAYKKLKRRPQGCFSPTDDQWRLYEYSIGDGSSIIEHIRSMG